MEKQETECEILGDAAEDIQLPCSQSNERLMLSHVS